MAHIITEQNGIGVLSANNKPEAIWADPLVPEANPFKDAMEYLDKTRGRWWHQNEQKLYGHRKQRYGNGRGLFVSKVNEQNGVAPTADVSPIYMSPYFDSWELGLANLPLAFGLFSALGLYLEVIDYPAFVTIADANYNDNVPAFLPGATYFDELEVEQNRTWAEWKLPQNHHQDIGDGNKYVPLKSMTGRHLAGSIIVQLIAAGFTVGYQKDMPQPAPVPE